MNKKYFKLGGSLGYGARIYIRREFWQEVRKVIDPLSSWGGVDQDDGNLVSWEFSPSQGFLPAVERILEKTFGFTLTEDFEKMQKESLA